MPACSQSSIDEASDLHAARTDPAGFEARDGHPLLIDEGG
jgi:hypothetical protein